MGQAFTHDFIRQLESREKVPAIFAKRVKFRKFSFSLLTVNVYASLGNPSVMKHFEYNKEKDMMTFHVEFYNQFLQENAIMTKIDIDLDIPLEFFGSEIRQAKDITKKYLDVNSGRAKVIISECLREILPMVQKGYPKEFPMSGKKSVAKLANQLIKDIFL